ncbi:DNA uptake protein [Leptolyngbya sp. BL0902]|uniref:ComEA family DNA-binding protein n=1 Tax=Leptolyngbya sp. BL0902 TaxID=1115757 RepID=UPI0018E78846|nr:ComEA family DNA-binding protein [Leptolyngbya sp. BL0902]QQE66595.1 DNA uptake protein [Leptolyngbya sp. BL0902]
MGTLARVLQQWSQQWQQIQGPPASLAQRLAQDPTYRLASLAEVVAAAELGFRLDVNQATVDDWLRLPGVSIRQAQVLVQLRQSGVSFHALDDLAAALGVTLQSLQPLAPVLAFCYYDDLSPLVICPVAINQATLADLARVPNLPESLAQAMVRDRQHRGPFRNMADLQRRLSLPAETIATLMHYLRC